MLWIYLAVYVIILFFFIIEGFLRKGSDAKTLEKSAYDIGSTDRIAFAIAGFSTTGAANLDKSTFAGKIRSLQVNF
jgi:hypothetical protein